MNTLPMPLLPSEGLSGYQVGRLIHQGEHDVIHEAVRLGFGRVALKRMSASSVVCGRWLARQEMERERLARRPAPHLPAVFDAGRCGDGLYCAVEFLGSETLTQLLRRLPRGGPHALAAVAELATSLQAAHDVGVLHLDLRPERLLLARGASALASPASLVRITGFVASARRFDRLAGRSDRDRRSPDGFLAPEQIVGTPVGERADVFALGAITYNLLTGRTPAHGEDRRPLRDSLILGGLDELSAAAWPALEAVLDRALAPDPGSRFPTPRAFAEALRLAWTERPTSIRCPVCNHQGDRAGRYCGRCGTPLEAVKRTRTPPVPAPPTQLGVPVLSPPVRLRDTPVITEVAAQRVPRQNVAPPAPQPPEPRKRSRLGPWRRFGLGAAGAACVVISAPWASRLAELAQRRWQPPAMPAPERTAPPKTLVPVAVPPPPPPTVELSPPATTIAAPPATAVPTYADAVALLAAGKDLEAVQAVSDFLAGAPADAPGRARAEYLLSVLRASFGQLELQVDIPGVRLFLDGKPIGESPVTRTLFVSPGPHDLTVARGLDPDIHRRFIIEPGARLALRLR